MTQMIRGKVQRGKQLGRTLGFPTANIQAESGVGAARGAYYGVAEVDGRVYRVILNIGTHPTAPEGPPTVEAHLLGFSGELYGRELCVKLHRYLRPEIHFASLEDLRRQLENDRAAVQRLPLEEYDGLWPI